VPEVAPVTGPGQDEATVQALRDVVSAVLGSAPPPAAAKPAAAKPVAAKVVAAVPARQPAPPARQPTPVPAATDGGDGDIEDAIDTLLDF
jgi:hypothetical protein